MIHVAFVVIVWLFLLCAALDVSDIMASPVFVPLRSIHSSPLPFFCSPPFSSFTSLSVFLSHSFCTVLAKQSSNPPKGDSPPSHKGPVLAWAQRGEQVATTTAEPSILFGGPCHCDSAFLGRRERVKRLLLCGSGSGTATVTQSSITSVGITAGLEDRLRVPHVNRMNNKEPSV